jgi:hypothetical protein
MPRKPLLEPTVVDWTRTVAGIDVIRRFNPQRHEFELLT